MRPKQCLPLLVVSLLMAGCAAERTAPPQRPMPAPAPVRPAPPPPISRPVPAPPVLDWQDLPLSPGSWTYDGGQGLQASFGASAPGFVLRCDLQSRQMLLMRPGITTGNVMTVRTTDTRRSLPLSVSPNTAATPYVSLNTDDPLLDSIIFSRGRFTIEVPGLPMLVLPSWPEPARVVEDCRR